MYDRRKREYALNLEGLLITSDLEPAEPGSVDASTLLLGCSGLWAQQIRDRYRRGVRNTAYT